MLVQECGGLVEDLGVQRLQVATHGRGRVLVPQYLLDVEQVEIVAPTFVRGPMEDGGGGAA